MRRNKDLLTIYIISIILSLVLFMGWRVIELPDSPSYIQASHIFLSGKIDSLRTPTYPLIIGICNVIFGENIYKDVVIILQYISYLISIAFFYKLVLEFIKKPNLCFWLTLFYAIFSAISGWNNCILTESFAITGSVFLLYSSTGLYKRFSIEYVFSFLFWFLFLLFLRPSFLYLLPVFFVFWISCLFARQHRRNAFAGLLVTLTVLFSQLCYISQFKNTYGVFSPSAVSTINNYYIERQYGLIYTDGIKNGDLKEDIKRSIFINGVSTDNHSLLWNETNELINKYSLKEVQQVVSISLKKNPIGFLKGAGGRAYKASRFPISISPLRGLSTLLDLIGANIGFLYLFLIAYAVIIVYWVYHQREMAYISMLFFMIGASNLISVIVFAQQEWSRLILPSMPIYILMFGQLCCILKINSPSKVEFD